MMLSPSSEEESSESADDNINLVDELGISKCIDL